MHLLITLRAFKPGINGYGRRHHTGKLEPLLQSTLQSNKIVASGAFSDLPGGFILVDIDSIEDVAGMLDNGLVENYYIEINHVGLLDTVAEHLERWYGAEQIAVPAREAG